MTKFLLYNIKILLFIALGFIISQNHLYAQDQLPEKKVAQEEQENQDDQEADIQNNALYETVKVKRIVSNVSKGYRIQIYSGPNREKARQVKIDFMKRFPSVRSYISYEVPHYKIKVGDFKSRHEAAEFYRYLNRTYTSMIVPSLINNKIPPQLQKNTQNVLSTNPINNEEKDDKEESPIPQNN
ncbi:MAG TPA: SPOR domain-containing protein [Edaphocola sp.]|nr:SPOR domain-containing protein [Edaphocola sp.]